MNKEKDNVHVQDGVKDKKNQFSSCFNAFWNGDIPLKKMFWSYSILPTALLIAINIYIQIPFDGTYITPSNVADYYSGFFVQAIVFFTYYGELALPLIVAVPLWRSAYRYKGSWIWREAVHLLICLRLSQVLWVFVISANII
jgi:hypothetical protein